MNELTFFNNLLDAFDDNCVLPSLNINRVCQGPKVDVKEGNEAYTLEMDLPGKTEKDIDIELNRNVLTISSEIKSAREEKKEEKAEMKEEKKNETKWLIRERSSAKFSRSFTLPEDVDGENLSANVKNGVLTVTMPRRAPVTPKKIEVTCA